VRILLTRPEPDAQRTADALRERGHEAVVAPLLRIEAVRDAAIGNGPWAAVLVTSANAAGAIAAHPDRPQLCKLPVFAVGRRSAQAMRAAGFAEVTSADGDIGDLARLVAAQAKPGTRILYLAGADRAGDLAGDLQPHGLAVDTVIVYHAEAVTALPAAAAAALAGGIDGVAHFSRRSAESYVDAARNSGVLAQALDPAHYCISAAAAEPLARAGARDIRIAARPAETALLELIGAAAT